MIFKINSKYSRKEIKKMLGLPKKVIEGNLNYFSFGLPRYLDTYYIFSNIGISSKTGHEYRDCFLSKEEFYWEGPDNSEISQKRFKGFFDTSVKKLLFVREKPGDKFQYKGALKIKEVVSKKPVRIVFQITCVDSILNFNDFEENINKINQKVYNDYSQSFEALFEEAKSIKGKPIKATTSADAYIRSPYVSNFVKIRAKGKCELCGKPAPFTKKNGEPYLEVHHIIHLANDGEDSVSNCIALCPNCHRELHYGVLTEENEKKLEKLLIDPFKEYE